jgi:hypothetical protein
MEPLALTVAQAARLGGPCRSAIYQDIRAGRLRAVKKRAEHLYFDGGIQSLSRVVAIVPRQSRPLASGIG